MTFVFTLNRAGGAEVLKQMAREEITSLARKIASEAGDAEVDTYTTDRAAASVTVPAHEQAKSGALTRAASATGLEVKPK